MARRRKKSSLYKDLMSIAAALPWWVSVMLACLSFGVLQWVALNLVTPNPSGLESLVDVVARQLIRTFAQFGQFIVPIAFLAGAVGSAFRRISGARLLAAAAEGIPRVESASLVPRRGSSMTWQEFEILVHEIYRRKGYLVMETGPGADGGVDLVLRRDGQRYFVQCKHWQAREVGVKIVRELKGVVAQAGAAGGAVVTSGRFTRDAVTFAAKAGIDLVHGGNLSLLARQLHREERSEGKELSVADDISASPVAAEPDCPTCGSSMVLRRAKRGPNAGGQFWGCSRFPVCKATLPLTQSELEPTAT